VGIADLNANLLTCISMEHPLDQPPEVVLSDTAALIEKALSDLRIDGGKVVGVGVGASGLVNPHSGVNVLAPNLGWRQVPIRDHLVRHLGYPVAVDNNARAMALGEALFGLGKDIHAMVFVYARVGVGAGIVVGERLFRGRAAGAGEIGHTTLVPDGGQPCRCGNTGCLETLVSEPAIVGLARELAAGEGDGILAQQLANGQGTAIERVFAAARAGHEPAANLLEERACYTGIALANLVNVLNPDLIVLGGILAQGADLLLPTIERTMRQRSFANLGDQVRIEVTGFGSQAGVVGATALALSSFFYQVPDPPAMG
jgi:glucokinase-like ROK family protein